MQQDLAVIKTEALAKIFRAADEAELEGLRVEYLGKSGGKLTNVIKAIPNLPQEQRAETGRLANDVKKALEEALAVQGETLRKRAAQTEKIDVTLPAIMPPEGHLHPITQVLHETLEIFKFLGYQVTETYEITSDYYNFTSLNMPKDAPSRDTQMTFYPDCRNSQTKFGEIVLQTQVTSMQVRILEKSPPPVRAIMPGKCYRVDDVDASHGFEFWQLDGFVVDKNIRMTDLLGTMDFVLRKLYGQEIKIRYEATYFAFVEPGVQAFISCTICRQRGCPFCKQTGWVEIMPAGMIHPFCLKNAGLSPDEWSGFAFDLGLSRAAVLKNQIDDLRVLTNPDLRILRQF